MPSYAIDHCMAKVIFVAALCVETPPMYVDASQVQCCPGGMVRMDFIEPDPRLKYFVTVVTPDILGGAAEHLKAAPELFEEQRNRAGKVTPVGKYIFIGPCKDDIAQTRSDRSSFSQVVSRSGICAHWHSSITLSHSLRR